MILFKLQIFPLSSTILDGLMSDALSNVQCEYVKEERRGWIHAPEHSGNVDQSCRNSSK
jgi:hypothetical protein